MKNLSKYFLLLFYLIIVNESLPQNFWQHTKGPYGWATVTDLLFYKDSIVFLATYEGLIKSLDNGQTWERIRTSRINCLASDSSGILYANENYLSNNFFLLKSTDDGISWKRMDLNIWPDAREIFITYKDTIFLATWNYGLCRSTNGGIYWVQINNGIENTQINTITVISNGILLAGTDGGGIYKSIDFGESWQPSSSGLPSNPSWDYKYAYSFCEVDSAEILVGTNSGIYYSSNCGNSWIERKNGYGNDGVSTLVKDNKGFIYAGADLNDGVYRSSDKGKNWIHLGLNNHIYTLGFDNYFNLYAGVSSNGLFKFSLSDSTWWQIYNKGYSHVEVEKISVTRSGNILANTNWWGLQYSSNDGLTWKKVNFSTEIALPLISINDSIIITGNSSEIFTSSDTGKTWKSTLSNSFGSFYYDSSNEDIYLGTDGKFSEICGIYISKDYGQSWDLLHEFEKFTNVYRWVEKLLVTSNNKYFFSTVVYSDRFGQTWKFFKSIDNGQTWSSILEGNEITNIIEDNYSNLYALSGTKLFVSTDEGETWITKNIPSSDFLASDFSGKIYLAKNLMLYYSTDLGTTWKEMNNSGIKIINDIKVNKDNRIYLATESGIFIGNADSLTLDIEKEKLYAKNFVLYQNYPNPFNPTTNIQYAVSSKEFVTLKVYDLLGRQVTTLVNEEKQPGIYEVELDGSNLSSGVYFYSLTAGDFKATRKLVIAK